MAIHLLLCISLFSQDYKVRASMKRRYWILEGNDAFGKIEAVPNPFLNFYENDTAVFTSRFSARKDFSLAIWSGEVEDFVKLSGRHNASLYTFRLGPTIHYFCSSCRGSFASGEIHVHPREIKNSRENHERIG
jgi:hypothetical protein